jgi:hypothetical protein
LTPDKPAALTRLRSNELRRARLACSLRVVVKGPAGSKPIRAAAHFYVMDNKYNFRYLIIASLFIMLFSACSRSSVIVENFEVKSGERLWLPVKHSPFIYPQTNIYFHFEPEIRNHPSRDYSDFILLKVYDKQKELIEISKIHDINGGGRTVQVSFVDKRPDVAFLDISFKQSCSGRIDIKSWQPL